jgi:hypothetical protein
MKIYSIEEAVKPNFPFERTINQLETMRQQLEELGRRLHEAAACLIPHADLCQGCEQFAADCLTVSDYDDLGQARIYCGECRKENQ